MGKSMYYCLMRIHIRGGREVAETATSDKVEPSVEAAISEGSANTEEASAAAEEATSQPEQQAPKQQAPEQKEKTSVPTKKPKHGANKAADAAKKGNGGSASKVNGKSGNKPSNGSTKRGAKGSNVAEPKAPSEKKSWAALAATAHSRGSHAVSQCKAWGE